MCMKAKQSPLSEIQRDVERHTGQPAILTSPKRAKITNKQLKIVGEAIYSTYDERCKDNFGKPVSEILVLVPEAGLQKKLSPTKEKKLKRDQQRKLKTDVENKMSQTDVDSHLHICESYSSRKVQRLAQSFVGMDFSLELHISTSGVQRV